MLDKARVYYEARTTYYSIVLIVNVIAMAALTSLAMDHMGFFLIGLVAYSFGLRSVLVTEFTAAVKEREQYPYERARAMMDLRTRLARTAVLWFSVIYTSVLTTWMLILQAN